MRKYLLAAVLFFSVFAPTAASAEVYVQSPGHTPRIASTDTGGTEVMGRQYVRAENKLGFALTGADVTGLAVVGVMLIGAGYVLVRIRRSGTQIA